MLLVCFLVVICYGNAARLVRMLGQSGTSILTRLSAFILLAIGIQILWTGLSVGIPQMLARRSRGACDCNANRPPACLSTRLILNGFSLRLMML